MKATQPATATGACTADAAMTTHKVPPYMAPLVDRAAMVMLARAVFQVDFTWLTDDEEHRYTARLEWFELTVRTVVHDARSGDYVCRSLPGEPFKIDPTCWEDVHFGPDA